MGFKIVRETGDTLIGTRTKFYWDAILTKVTYVCFVRRVAKLDAATIEMDRNVLENEAKTLDPSALPRGFQKGVAVITAYLADEASVDAMAICDDKPKVRFAFFYVPGVRNLGTKTAHFVRGTPAWGALYYGKFRWILGRLLEPESAPAKEPLSKGGAIMGLVFLLVIVLNVALIVGR